MKRRKNKHDPAHYYNYYPERYSIEGDELPFNLEHITSEDLYDEFISDTSDDHLLELKRSYERGKDERNESKTSRDLLHSQQEK